MIAFLYVQVDLESRIGRTTIVDTTKPFVDTGGFYCDVCFCEVKDSTSYFDHINGVKREFSSLMLMRMMFSSQIRKHSACR